MTFRTLTYSFTLACALACGGNDATNRAALPALAVAAGPQPPPPHAARVAAGTECQCTATGYAAKEAKTEAEGVWRVAQGLTCKALEGTSPCPTGCRLDWKLSACSQIEREV
jgi:hypothetical protein